MAISVGQWQLRAGAVSDLNKLVALENHCFSNDRLSRRSFRHYLTAKNAELVVADSDGQLLGYGLLLLRRGTLLTRLYSLAVHEDARGQRLAEAMVLWLEQRATARGKRYMRLEVAEHNQSAQRLYERMGFLPFGMFEHYYEDDTNAIRMQKALPLSGPEKTLRRCPWYQQTTEFTCGPASLLMAMAMLDHSLVPNQRDEFSIWREANTVYMTSGPAGTHPIGLAMAAQTRGFDVKVYLNQGAPLFVDGVRNEHKRQTLQAVEENFFSEAEQQQLPVFYLDWLTRLDNYQNMQDCALVCLISTYRFDRTKAPHWVVVTAIDDQCVYIHDPDPSTPGAMDYQHVPIAREDFIRMASYGKRKIKAAIVLRQQAQSLVCSDLDLAV